MEDLYVVRFGPSAGLPMEELATTEPGDQDEDKTPEVKTTFAHFGLAFYHACVLEHEIVNILAVTHLVAAQQDAQRLLSDPWDDKFKLTMGALVKQLGAQVPTDPELGADLIEALRLRNHLAHAFWRDRADDFCTEAGRAQMIAFLIDARKSFQDVDNRLTERVGAASLRQLGLTSDVIDAWYRDTLQQVEHGELKVPLATVEAMRQSLLTRIEPPTTA